LEITDVRIRRITPLGKMRAIASVTFNDQFVIHDLRIIEGSEGLFLAMPSKRTPGGQFRDIAHPIKPEMRAYIQRAVIDCYAREIETLELVSV
jgi:stage V sporulation protein G